MGENTKSKKAKDNISQSETKKTNPKSLWVQGDTNIKKEKRRKQ